MAIVVDQLTDVSADTALLNDETPVTSVESPESDKEILSDEEPLGDQEVTDETTDETTEEVEKGKDLLPHERPSMAQIKEKFPEFFKTFPALRDVIFREKEYATIFPTVEDAAKADENSILFNDLRNDVTTGEGDKFLNSLKEAQSLPKFAANFLPKLQKLDPDTHWNVVAPVLEHAVRAFYREGKVRSSEDMVNAANHLALFLFGDTGFANGSKTNTKVEKEEDKTVKSERETWEREKLQTFDNSVQGDIRSGLKSQILAGFPKEGITDFVRDALVGKIISEIDKSIASDNTHIAFVRRLWAKAKAEGFRSDLKDSIVNAYLSRAKSLTPSIRRRLLSEALGTSFADKNRPAESVTPIRREPGQSGRAPSGNVRNPTAKSVNWKKTSDLDMLNDRVTLKK